MNTKTPPLKKNELSHTQIQHMRRFRMAHAKEMKDFAGLVMYIAQGYRLPAEYIIDDKKHEVLHGTVFLQVQEAEGMWKALMAKVDAAFTSDTAAGDALKKQMARETRHLSQHAMSDPVLRKAAAVRTPPYER